MKNIKIVWLMMTFACLIVFTMSNSFAQRVVPIASGDGVIETAINNDAGWTTDTWYELERDGYYTVMTPISNPSSRHIRIRAAAGTGFKPIVRPYAGTARCFAPTGDLTLDGLYINAVDAASTLKQNSVRTAGAGIRITINDCHLDRDLQSVLRVESANTRCFVTKSYISNLGLMADNNGRAWDDRGNNVDTVFFEDNIIYNLTGRMTRDGGGIVNYFYFNHNTFVNVFDRPFASGDAKEVHITNNLFVNTYFRGYDSLETSQINTLQYSGVGERIYRVHHNNFHMTPALIDAYKTTFGPRGVITAQLLFDSLSIYLLTQNGDLALNNELPITFNNSPADSCIGPMKDYWDNSIPVGQKRNIYCGPDSCKGCWSCVQVPFDFKYSTSNPLYTAGICGKPLGALFIWGLDLCFDGVGDEYSSLPSNFNLSQNYPNPFNPATKIRFSLSKQSTISLKIFDPLGREVAVLDQGIKPPGEYEKSLDGLSLSTGTYYYSLTVDGVSSTKKMILVK